MKLVLLRHGESKWNQQNLFTGWTDVGLSKKGEDEAAQAGVLLKQEGFQFDICYTSYLKRAIHTMNYALEQLDREWIPIVKSYKLNERHYGALQGLNKEETARKYGEEQVKIWRRSFDIKPPILEEDDPRNPRLQAAYQAEEKANLPLAESLKDTIARVIPYFEEEILKSMKEGKQVLVVAHGNSLRALMKYFDNLSEQEITGVNIPTGIPLVYEFDDEFKVKQKYYLGDQDALKAEMEKVANQGSLK